MAFEVTRKEKDMKRFIVLVLSFLLFTTFVQAQDATQGNVQENPENLISAEFVGLEQTKQVLERADVLVRQALAQLQQYKGATGEYLDIQSVIVRYRNIQELLSEYKNKADADLQIYQTAQAEYAVFVQNYDDLINQLGSASGEDLEVLYSNLNETYQRLNIAIEDLNAKQSKQWESQMAYTEKRNELEPRLQALEKRFEHLRDSIIQSLVLSK